MYAPLSGSLAKVFPEFPLAEKIPAVQTLNLHLKACNQLSQPLCFSAQNCDLPFPELGYEERIYQHGLIATRANNWHDFFNAMVWMRFPQIKSALNAVHHQEQNQQQSSKRSRRRDWLTLFDESGVIVVAQPEIKQLMKNHRWQELFVEKKHLWNSGEIKVFTFGHALYEKYLQPYIGMTAHAIVIETENENEHQIDSFLSEKILQNQLLTEKSDLTPLPLLGIPEWYECQNSEFYANRSYFRPKPYKPS